MVDILSMTGCGYARLQVKNNIVTVEIKSVNSRYLDVNCKMPRMYSRVEEKLKTSLGKVTTRGKVDLYVTVEALPGQENAVISLDETYLAGYLACLEKLKTQYNLFDDISVMNVAQNRDIFTSVQRQEATVDELWENLEPSVEKACLEFYEMKKTEGKRLAADILAKLDEIEKMVDKIEQLAPVVVSDYSKRLTERIEEMLGSSDYDKTRIIEEVAIFADKVAVDEELVRLHSHMTQFRKIISETKDEPCGRKLDFLLQEINREINTTGSKCNNAEIAKIVVEVKSEAEKIREQVQNIE